MSFFTIILQAEGKVLGILRIFSFIQLRMKNESQNTIGRLSCYDKAQYIQNVELLGKICCERAQFMELKSYFERMINIEASV